MKQTQLFQYSQNSCVYRMEDLQLQMASCQEIMGQKAGYYNSLPTGVPFFEEGQESFLSDYGCFFLECIIYLLIFSYQKSWEINVLQRSCTICAAATH
ncbi:hypothetical protein V6N12_041459 [Hibiscus sabdariffa]|uniref:Uncharacterized protein n=1 Tax=Hibiscus sabdariffa TaxID=183260 RepID=A0ABR2AHA9_9ROSI